MPNLPKAPCPHPGCGKITGGGRCDRHRRLMERADRVERGTSADRGYDRRWRKLRRTFLAAHPVCKHHLEATPSRVVPATVVDHIVPHRGDDRLRLDWDNLQALCKRCHDSKTATHDSGRARRAHSG